ncbi:hypothetical protein TUM3792_35730 [Shewanella sp. MBTL60-007]|nr:hypothetical protein TUM3792_35730 [Shewanella sp. MBTL60-007]
MSKVSIGIDVKSKVIRDYYLSIRKSRPTGSSQLFPAYCFSHNGAKLSLETHKKHQFPIGVAEVRWNKSCDADMDVGVAFAGQDAPSEALAIYPKVRGRQLRLGR